MCSCVAAYTYYTEALLFKSSDLFSSSLRLSCLCGYESGRNGHQEMACFPRLQHDKVALNSALLEIQTVGRARIGLNTDRLPRVWRSVDHHMWKLRRVKRDGGLDVTLLVLQRAAHQP